MKKTNVTFLMAAALITFLGCTPPGFDATSFKSAPLLRFHKAATGSLSANPASCTVDEKTGLCSVTINWSSADADIVQVKADGKLFGGARSGSNVAPWITTTPTKFELWADGAKIAQFEVVGYKKGSSPPAPVASGKLTANPTTCVVNPSTHVCSSTIGWSSSNAKDVKVYANGNLFTASTNGSSIAPWIGLGDVVFELRGDGVTLDKITVVGTTGAPPPSPTPSPSPIPPVGKNQPVIMNSTDCQATNAATLNSCAKGLVDKKYTGIAIMNDITCSGPRACKVHLDHFTGPARIYGYRPDGGKVTIFRKDTFDYAMIEIVTSSDIEIRNLDFREGDVNKPAGPYPSKDYDHNVSSPGWDHNVNGDSNYAEPPISIIFGSKNVFVDNIGVYEAKNFGMIIGNCDYVTVRNSIFKHNWNNGIWVTNGLSDIVPNDHAPINIRIENNTFVDNRCVSIGLSAQGDSWVSGNYISHNHMGSVWHATGGQFSIEETTRSLKVVDNEIANGIPDEDPYFVAHNWMTVGVEFTDSDVKGVILDHNYIHNNTGGGVIHDPNPNRPRTNFGPIIAKDNVINNPWTPFGLFDPGELIETGTCLGAACTWKKSTGEISSSAQTCSVSSAGSCALNITWSSVSARTPDIKVLLDGKLVSTKTSGSQSVTISQGLHRFDLYDGVTLLDSVYVGAK